MFFIDLPTKSERKEIISLYLNKYLNIKVSSEYLEKLAILTENFSGSDIESKIRELAYKTVSDNLGITEEILTNLFKDAVSSYQTNKEKIDIVRNWAKNRTVRASKSENA